VIVNKEEKTAFISQEAYITEILKRFGVEQCNGAPTSGTASSAATIKMKEDARECRLEIVGALRCLVSGLRLTLRTPSDDLDNA
jgi:hypothetical protein